MVWYAVFQMDASEAILQACTVTADIHRCSGRLDGADPRRNVEPPHAIQRTLSLQSHRETEDRSVDKGHRHGLVVGCHFGAALLRGLENCDRISTAALRHRKQPKVRPLLTLS